MRTVPDRLGASAWSPGSPTTPQARPPRSRRVALGAAIIEKHFTLARADGGPDAAFSLEPAEFAALVRDCKAAWSALGSATYDELGCERAAAGHAARSTSPRRDAGEALSARRALGPPRLRPRAQAPAARSWAVAPRAT